MKRKKLDPLARAWRKGWAPPKRKKKLSDLQFLYKTFADAIPKAKK